MKSLLPAKILLRLFSWIFQGLLDDILLDLLIAKLHACGVSEDVVTFVYSYLKRMKQGVKINDIESFIQILLSGVTQDSILGPILFNYLINDLFLFIKDVKLTNFAHENTIDAEKKKRHK